MTAEDEERGGQQWCGMEDCSTDDLLWQETLYFIWISPGWSLSLCYVV